jgi:hypothetical protein
LKALPQAYELFHLAQLCLRRGLDRSPCLPQGQIPSPQRRKNLRPLMLKIMPRLLKELFLKGLVYHLHMQIKNLPKLERSHPPKRLVK